MNIFKNPKIALKHTEITLKLHLVRNHIFLLYTLNSCFCYQRNVKSAASLTAPTWLQFTLSVLRFSSSGPGYASHAPDAHAAHASWYGHAPGHVYDARRAPATRHPHGNGAPRSSPSRHVAGWSAEDGSAESSHGVTAGGESQAAGQGSGDNCEVHLLHSA